MLAGRVRVGAGDGARSTLKPGDLVDPDAPVAVDGAAALRLARRPEARRRARRVRGRPGRARLPGRRAPRRAASRTCSCSAAPSGSTRWTSAAGQLAEPLRRDARVVVRERVNARALDAGAPRRSRWTSRSSTSRSSRSGSSSARRLVPRGREAGSSRSSSRSSRPAAGTRHGGVVRDPAVHRDVLARRGRDGPRGSASRPLGLVRVAAPRAGRQPRVLPRPRRGRRDRWRSGGWRCDRRRAGRRGVGRPDRGGRRRMMRIRRIGFAYNPTSEAALELRSGRRAGARCAGIEHWASPAGERDAPDRELPGHGRARRARRRRDVPARRPGRGRGGRPAPRRQPRQGRLPLQGRGPRARAAARPARARAPTASRSAWPCAGAIQPGGASGPRPDLHRPQRRRRRPRLAGPRRPAGRRHRAVAPGHVHRRRAGRRQPHRIHRLLVLGRRPDPGPAEPQPHRHADRRLPVGDPLGRGEPAPGRPLPGRGRPRGARLDRRARGPPARGRRRGRRSRPWSGRSASSSRTARCRSGTSCGRRPSCCRPDRWRRASRRRAPPGRLLELAVSRPRAASTRPRLAVRARAQRADRRDRRRQEPADRRPRASPSARGPTRRSSGTARRRRASRRSSTGSRSR